LKFKSNDFGILHLLLEFGRDTLPLEDVKSEKKTRFSNIRKAGFASDK
jgi:hypothetical protein